MQQAGGGDGAKAPGPENTSRLGEGAVLSEFSSLARGAVTPPPVYALARHLGHLVADVGVKVQESNNAYTSRSDDVSVMLKTPNIVLVGFPGFDRHFDRAEPRAELSDIVDLVEGARLCVPAAADRAQAERCRRRAVIDVATIGWLTVDDIVLTDGTCRLAVRGGGALYSAVGARIWSDSVGIHSVAGRPHFAETRRQIEARGIDATGVGRTDGNGLELWLLHESEIHKQQVPKLTSTNAIELDALRGPLPQAYAGARAFHIAPQGPESGLANAKKIAALSPRPVATMDILADEFIDASAYRDLAFLSHLTAFMPSETEIERIWRPSSIEGWLVENAEFYGCNMIAKLGERGSLVCEATTGALTHVPAFPVRVVDTTGAGDAYCGGFVAGLAAGHPLVTCAAMATVSASYVVEACGALATHQPTVDERNDRLQRALSAARPFPNAN